MLYGKGIAGRHYGGGILHYQVPQREGTGSKGFQHGERRRHPAVELCGASVAAVAVCGRGRGTLAHPEPLYRQDDRFGTWRRGGGHMAAPVEPHQRAEPVLGAGTHPQRAHPHPQCAGG